MLLLIQFHLWYYYNFPPISCSSQSEGAKCKHHGWIRGGGDLVWRWLGGRRAEQDPDGAGGQQPRVWRIAAGGLLWSWQRGFVWKMSYSLAVLVQVLVLCVPKHKSWMTWGVRLCPAGEADGEGSPSVFSSASAVGLCSCCPTSPPLAVHWCPPACRARRMVSGWWLPKQAQHIKGSAQVTANSTPCASTFTMCS